MKRILVAVAVAAAVVASTAGAGSGGNGSAYQSARTWDTALGEVFGPVRAGPETSASYGFIAK